MSTAINEHLFKGEIRGFWRLLARGADRSAIVHHRHTNRGFDFGLDGHGHARRNAGIIAPTDRSLGAGRWLYRFVGTIAFNTRRLDAVMGNWWLDEDVWLLLRQEALHHRTPLPMVAQNYLALPEEWGDRGRVVKARLTSSVMVWSGVGEVAQGIQGRHTPMQQNKAVQLFIPGTPELIVQAFGGLDNAECLHTRDAVSSWS
ncbi:MAG: hypothetical protein AB9M60_21030 [Leptothrix sp. (in: b-proteobacteria)]